jgi:Spy/CpxP family protein refolding chaperone
MYTPILGRLLTLSALVGMAAGLCVTSPAWAQNPPGGAGQGQGRRGGGRQMSLARMSVSQLDAIVKLTADQKAKITPIHDDYVKQATALRPQAGQRPDDATMQKMRDLSTQATQQIEAILTPAQKTRLEEARKEFGLYRLAGIPLGLYGKIHLSGDQKTKLEAIQQTVTASRSGGDRQAMRAAMQAAREQAAAVLTADQKKEIEAYVAAHPNEQRGQGGRRGAGGAGA